jgi:hypothetical protein
VQAKNSQLFWVAGDEFPLRNVCTEAEKQGVPGKSKPSASKTAKSPAAQATTPIRMVVRRGALARYENLKKKTAHLQVEVVWDQRDTERRQERSLSDSERRKRDRRRPPPFTWDLADFVVVTPPKPVEPTKPKGPVKK